MNWIAPSVELPDPKRQVIVAWFDGQVTYCNYAHAINWDAAQYWSYMPAHPQNTKELGTTPNTGSPKSAPEIIESVSVCPYCVHGDSWKNGGCHREASSKVCFVGRSLRALRKRCMQYPWNHVIGGRTMERFLIANSLVPDNEVWVSPATYDKPFGLKAKEPTATDTQQLKAEIRAISDIIEVSESGLVTVDFAVLKQRLRELSAI